MTLIDIKARRSAREIAMHIIYESGFGYDSIESITNKRLSEESFSIICGDAEVYSQPLPSEECVYIRKLTNGIAERKPELIEIISEFSANWKQDRISRINKTILLIALYEILYIDDIDTSVSINEAVELSKTYDSPEASSFVNGVLGGYIRRSEDK